MTFSQLTKEEIRKNINVHKPCCKYAFLYAVFRSLGSFSLYKGNIGLVVATENKLLLEQAVAAYKELFGKTSVIEATDKNTFSNNLIFSAVFDKVALFAMDMLYRDSQGDLQLGSEQFADRFVQGDCCKRTFVQTVFVCCGSVVVPDSLADLADNSASARYHMEMVFGNSALADNCIKLLHQSGFNFRLTTRKRSTVIYLKDSEVIADMLVFMNSVKAKLELENVIIERNIRNNANRQSNCNLANIDKSVEASQRHIDAIKLLQESGLIQSLPLPLQELALLRMDNQEATLAELATMRNLSKSGIRHQLNRLVLIAENLHQRD